MDMSLVIAAAGGLGETASMRSRPRPPVPTSSNLITGPFARGVRSSRWRQREGGDRSTFCRPRAQRGSWWPDV